LLDFMEKLDYIARSLGEFTMAYTKTELLASADKKHVSNVILFDYLDRSRQSWYKYCIENGAEAVVVHVSMDYKKEVFNGDQLIVFTSLERIGYTSFLLRQRIENNDNKPIMLAEVVMATIDRQTRTKTRVPDQVRNLLNLEGEIHFDHIGIGMKL
jgi:thioesterase III